MRGEIAGFLTVAIRSVLTVAVVVAFYAVAVGAGQPRTHRTVAVLQTFGACVQRRATEWRRRRTGVRVGACVRVFVTLVKGTRKVVVATARRVRVKAVSIDADIYGAEQSVVAVRRGRARLGARGAGGDQQASDDREKERQPRRLSP